MPSADPDRPIGRSSEERPIPTSALVVVTGDRTRARYDRALPALIQLIHPAPAIAVTVLSAVLAWILAAEGSIDPDIGRVVATTLAVFGSQILVGALNDWADRGRDAGRADKPLATGQLRPETALAVAGAGLLLQLAASAVLAPLPLALGAVASGSAVAYDLGLSRTPLSPLPYLVSFGILPLWIGAGVGVPLERVAPAGLLVAPFAAAAHLANVLRDFDADAAAGSRNLAQWIGRRRAHLLSAALALLTGAAIGIGFGLAGRLSWWSAGLGALGLGAIVIGARTPQGLWNAILVAAVAWTGAWALAST
jgi:4-hydroxybenzoate polyprenyltransferase